MRPSLVLLTIISFAKCDNDPYGVPCTEYGCPRRVPLVPAPPGETPSCAKPGQTYCETVDNYPRELIKFLLDKRSFDYSTLLRDESRDESTDDFNIYRSVPSYFKGYDYTPHRGSYTYSQPPPPFPLSRYPLRGQPALTYGPPSNDTHHYGYRHSTPGHLNPFLADGTAPVTHHPDGQPISARLVYSRTQISHSYQPDQALPESSRYPVNVGKQLASVQLNFGSDNPLSYRKLSRPREKRQSNDDSISVCETQQRYILPQAGMNKDGNWLFVVNLPEQRQNRTQLVITEECTTNECNGICSIPEGYTSKCKQQRVQKRLLSLDPSGSRTYFDVFWFPHGCMCQVERTYPQL